MRLLALALPALVGLLAAAAPLGALPVAGVPVPPALELPELCTFTSSGVNPYLVLLPGWTLQFEGVDEEGAVITLEVTVLDETRIVDGVETRVLFEEEREDNKLAEQSWNWLAICQESGSVFYFGEAVDIYKGGGVIVHDGSWEAGGGQRAARHPHARPAHGGPGALPGDRAPRRHGHGGRARHR
jgi:hypothetical protein